MNAEDKKKIEETFRNSVSSDELFDAFQAAIKFNLSDIDTFKILIANPALSPSEIKMFTEKLIKEKPRNAFDLLLWTGKVFESHPNYYNHMEDTVLIYERAIKHNPPAHEPLIKLLNLYNHEIDLPINSKILEIIDESIAEVNKKSEVFYSLAEHYRKCGDAEKKKKYFALAEKAVKSEN